MKLLMENWRKFLTEGTASTAGMPAHLDRKKIEAANKKFLSQQGYTTLRELGRGSYGIVYEVQDEETGERLAAKVVKTETREKENYEFAMNNKASMPPEYAKYLPEVTEIMPGPPGRYVIFMELLKPLPRQVAQELFAMEDAPDASQKPQKILKNPEAVAELTQRVVNNNRILLQMREFLVDREKTIKAAVNAVTKTTHAGTDALIMAIYGAVVREIEFQSPAISKAFEKALKSDVLFYLDKQIVPVHQPEPDDPDPDDLWTGPALGKTQDLFPEAEGLIKAMKYFMQDQNWRPKDVHIKNVMMRPATNDFVIVDLGLFQRGVFE